MAKSFFLVAYNMQGEEVHRTEWSEHIYELTNARNRAWKWMKSGKYSKIEIYSTETMYTQEPATLEMTITENPYTRQES